ncbi:hypothetical protein F5884DRAFT_726496 [Xylogone sp. PMI_703]|nr:hypothetical protein F5884DRAFT_726496 [Xylogone sp. PMI_703]
MSSPIEFIYEKWFLRPKDPQTSLAGKTILITGASAGIGFESALKIARLGASRLILAVRNREKGEAAKARIERETGRSDCIEIWDLDMVSYSSIQELANRASTDLQSLDIAILNAGTLAVKYSESSFGWETMLQVNVLSTALLGLLLLPKLRASKSKDSMPVLEIVNSAMYEIAAIDATHHAAPNLLKSYNKSDGFAFGPQYNLSKLFTMCATLSLASHATTSSGEPEVLVVGSCPGACKTEFGRELYTIMPRAVINTYYSICFKKAEVGARSIVSALLLDKDAHGRFWKNDTLRELKGPLAGEKKDQLQSRVWQEIVEALEKDVPSVKEYLKT